MADYCAECGSAASAQCMRCHGTFCTWHAEWSGVGRVCKTCAAGMKVDREATVFAGIEVLTGQARRRAALDYATQGASATQMWARLRAAGLVDEEDPVAAARTWRASQPMPTWTVYRRSHRKHFPSPPEKVYAFPVAVLRVSNSDYGSDVLLTSQNVMIARDRLFDTGGFWGKPPKHSYVLASPGESPAEAQGRRPLSVTAYEDVIVPALRAGRDDMSGRLVDPRAIDHLELRAALVRDLLASTG